MTAVLRRFYFDLYNGIGLVADEEGRELPDLHAARREAIKGVRSVLAAELLKGSLDLTGKVVVRDETGAEALVIPFTDVLTIKGP